MRARLQPSKLYLWGSRPTLTPEEREIKARETRALLQSQLDRLLFAKHELFASPRRDGAFFGLARQVEQWILKVRFEMKRNPVGYGWFGDNGWAPAIDDVCKSINFFVSAKTRYVAGVGVVPIGAHTERLGAMVLA